MTNKHVGSISLKALVDKSKEKIIFVESDERFVDLLFSFLTIPMGMIIRLTSDRQPGVDIGCMNNLIRSTQYFNVKYLRNEVCKTVLLCRLNVAETNFWSNSELMRYFLCFSDYCTESGKLFSYREGFVCKCGNVMNLYNSVPEKSKNAVRAAVLVKGRALLSVSDDLQVNPMSTSSSFLLLSELGVVDLSTVQERTFVLGLDEVLILLKRSLVSKTPLTETLLKRNPIPQMNKTEIYQEFSNQSCKEPDASSGNGNGKICIKIMVSKTRNQVCFAEAGRDFIDLLFSFLTLPLGYIVKQKGQDCFLKGCVGHLYKSVQDLDVDNYEKLNEHKAKLVGYEYQPFSIEEVSNRPYYFGPIKSDIESNVRDILTTDKTLIQNGKEKKLTIGESSGFIEGPVMFTVTDDLLIKPISSISAICILNNLKVPINDIEECVVWLGNEEASRLLVASLESQSALTNTFLRREPKQEEKVESSLSSKASFGTRKPKQELNK